MRGRLPIPTRLKRLANTRKDRINALEPQYPPSSLRPPAELKGLALEHWRELAPVLRELGLLTVADRFAMVQLCNAYAYSRRYPDDVGSRKLYFQYLKDFGLTP